MCLCSVSGAVAAYESVLSVHERFTLDVLSKVLDSRGTYGGWEKKQVKDATNAAKEVSLLRGQNTGAQHRTTRKLNRDMHRLHVRLYTGLYCTNLYWRAFVWRAGMEEAHGSAGERGQGGQAGCCRQGWRASKQGILLFLELMRLSIVDALLLPHSFS